MAISIPDPMHYLQELLVIAIAVIAIIVLIRFRKNVLLAITGDDHLHGGILDLGWFLCCKCCGTCNGGWTTYITCIPCCPSSLYRRNLVKVFGRWAGMWSSRVELRNIVVGDIPWKGRGDFFLAVECAYNPTMVTSVAENADPKVLHFPEVLSLRLRNNPLEKSVRITLKEVDFLGFNEICEVRLSTPNVIDWSSSDDQHVRLKRFEMKPIDRTQEMVTPPWILVEFSEEMDERRIDELEGQPGTIRLTTMTTQNDGTTIRNLQDLNTKDVKEDHPLLDGTGSSVQEPDEADLTTIRRLSKCLRCLYNFIRFIITMAILGYGLFRFYIFSCYREFYKLTIASLKNIPFPISAFELRKVFKSCEHEVAGEGITPGTNPCRPSSEQVLKICKSLKAVPGANATEDQPRPTAFTNTINQLFNLDVEGAKCFDGVCELRDNVAPWDLVSCGVIVGLLVLLCVFHFWMDWCIRHTRQQKAQEHTKRMKEAMRNSKNIKRGAAYHSDSDSE